MNGMAEAPGKVWFFELAVGGDRRRSLHPVRHLRRRLPVELDRHRRGHRPARAREDVHRLLALLGLLPPRRPSLRGPVAAVDPEDRGHRGWRPSRSAPTPRTPTGRSPAAPRPTGSGRCSSATPCASSARNDGCPGRRGRHGACSPRCWRPARSTGRWFPAERGPRRAVEGRGHRRHDPGRAGRGRRAASTTRPWRWPRST